MKNLIGQTAILTGASGGLGEFMAYALADAGLTLFLVAYPGDGLENLRVALAKRGYRAATGIWDLRVPEERKRALEQARVELGGIDVLINNAGVEFSAAYHELPERDIEDVLRVNLEAPMMLTHAVLPEMLSRGQGHIVNISSLAGRFAPGFQEPYVATKAALTAFTYSLRGTYRKTGVSASVVCPGFVEAGIYSRIKAIIGKPAPGLLGLGVCSPESVARAVVHVIRRDLPEVFVSNCPVRPLLALGSLSPSLGAWITDKILAAHDFFRSVAEARKSSLRG